MRTLPDYARLVQEAPEEAGALLSDMLISVTQFFRDPEAFETLALEVIAPLFDDVSEEGIRAWVAGCATGEEAYSIAMLFAEEATRRKVRVPIQIFATDLDDDALAVARRGYYPGTIEVDVSDERLQRFFVQEGEGYRIRKEIRDMVLFAAHSVLRDPPFLRLDLISCRNLLIYVERPLQEKLCSLFYYGLRQQRYLFLGSAETADAEQQLFTPMHREARLYQSRAQAPRTLPIIADGASAGRQELRASDAAPGPAGRDASPVVLHEAALEQAAPPSVLVDDAHRILHLSPGAGRFILHSGGVFSGRLSSVVLPELRLDLGHAIERATVRKLPTLTIGVSARVDGMLRRIALNVSPVPSEEGPATHALVLFLDGGPEQDEGDAGDADEAGVGFGRMRSELRSAKEALAVSRAEHELAMQELRAANEELQSINEEYRSTAEELETSKEELQSMNEELHTVNAELKKKLQSISTAHDDLRNLTAATEIGTLFLDRQLGIRMFTPPIADLFNVTDSDIGRPLTDFTNRLRNRAIDADVRRVLDDLTPLEAEIESVDGRWLMMRVRPYRTVEDRIDGAVVTFIDIGSLRNAQSRELESEAKYRLLFDAIDQGFCVIEMMMDDAGKAVDYRFLAVNRAFAEQTGIADAVGRTMREIAPTHEDQWFENYARVAETQVPEQLEGPAAALGRYFEVHAFPFGEPGERQVGVLFQEITERRRAETERQMLTLELSHRVKNTLAVVQALASQTSRNMTSVEQFRTTFIGRLHALARAHDLLLATQWNSADIKKLVETALDVYATAGADAISIKGQQVDLTPKQGLGLSLILHELSTNAAKYGALSTPEGRLSVRWEVMKTDLMHEIVFVWEERGGPVVSPPASRGFGTRLIERASRFEMGGEAELKFEPEGCTMNLCFSVG
ncbi:CheR family methyltransferase [Polymorphobacter multimanifer]|uniref:histidine kinase n=1 Tax=Polymorphobacter multimanifer TaxID=1070431 RepID=A0A841L0J9_9SPHN|nr:CheR family methyltransferase [Polymorphobacter multimanifer]MBB6225930.1 two-component system CheB/CheR fusion protein [Polymorphobacter multimanifer]